MAGLRLVSISGMETCVDKSSQILENKTTGEVMGYEGTSGG